MFMMSLTIWYSSLGPPPQYPLLMLPSGWLLAKSELNHTLTCPSSSIMTWYQDTSNLPTLLYSLWQPSSMATAQQRQSGKGMSSYSLRRDRQCSRYTFSMYEAPQNYLRTLGSWQTRRTMLGSLRRKGMELRKRLQSWLVAKCSWYRSSSQPVTRLRTILQCSGWGSGVSGCSYYQSWGWNVRSRFDSEPPISNYNTGHQPMHGQFIIQLKLYNLGMERRNWLQLSRTLVQQYKVCTLGTALRSLPLQIFITAVSSFSGPIALLLDKGISHQFVIPSNFLNAIIIFNCKGELKKTVPYNARDKVMFMGFTRIEELLVVEASGDYWLIDPFSGQVHQGSYNSPLYSTPDRKVERYRGCELLPNNTLVLLKQKQLGLADNLREKWQPVPELKIRVENPVFGAVHGEADEIAYLSKDNTLELYNFTTKKKAVFYNDSYLNDNWENLLAFSYNKQARKLGLIFCKPSLILYIDTATNEHKRLDAMIELKYGLQSATVPGLSYRYPSKNVYKPTKYFLSWLAPVPEPLDPAQPPILIFSNPKLLLLYNGQSTRLSPRSNCNQLLALESDCLHIYTQDCHEIVRVVPHLYQTVIEIERIREGEYWDRYRQIIGLHRQYMCYLEGEVVDLRVLGELWKMSRVRVVRDGEQEMRINLENTPEVREEVEKAEDQVLKPLISAVRYCIDPVDQVKMLKFTCFVKNLYNSAIDIEELCGEMRIINNLRFQFLNRTLTVNEFQHLKNEDKDRFLTILLRSNMHFIADMIFGDSDSKYRIFLHWAKCKIEKNNEAIAFEEIRQKFDSLPRKQKNTRVFTDIAKYCLDRGKEGLAESLIELDENPDRRIMVYLLMLVAKTDKRVAEKLVNCAQQTTRSFLIYRVVKELIEAKWIDSHLWINILHDKPNVSRHYVNYLKQHKMEQQLKNYYLQTKELQNLGMLGLERVMESQMPAQEDDSSYNELFLNKLLPRVEELKKFLPGLSAVARSYTKNQDMDMLRKVKLGGYVPSEEDIKLIRNDLILQYLGQLLFQKQKIDSAVSALSKIKSDKVYNILLRKERYRDAIEIAFARKNKQAIQRVGQMCPLQMQNEVEQRLLALNRK